MKRFERILACTDFSDVGNRAVEMAFGLVLEKTQVCLLHVLDPPQVPNPMYAHYVSQGGWEPDGLSKARDEAKKALGALIPEGVSAVQVDLCTPQGQPQDEILRLTDELDIEVIVMGTHGRTGLERFLLGSVTERVVRVASCAVMVVH